MGLHQNGGFQFGTIRCHNQFGTNLLRTQKITSSYPHRVWKGKAKFDYPNPGLERLVWNNQGTIQQT